MCMQHNHFNREVPQADQVPQLEKCPGVIKQTQAEKRGKNFILDEEYIPSSHLIKCQFLKRTLLY